jgi:hypothetical protein
MLSTDLVTQLYDILAKNFEPGVQPAFPADRYVLRVPARPEALAVLGGIKWGRHQSAETSRGLAWNLTLTLPGLPAVTYTDNGGGGEATIDTAGNYKARQKVEAQLDAIAKDFFVREEADAEDLIMILADARDLLSANHMLRRANAKTPVTAGV